MLDLLDEKGNDVKILRVADGIRKTTKDTEKELGKPQSLGSERAYGASARRLFLQHYTRLKEVQ